MKRKQWTDSNMVLAMEAVKEGQSVSGAAKQFGVPRRTLDDRVKGRVEHGTHPGPKSVLSAEEERGLVSYLVHMAQRGFPLTPKMTMAFAWAIAAKSGKKSRFSDAGPSHHWWADFRKRHPELTLRKMDKLDRSRAENLTDEVVSDYFNSLENVLNENGLLNRPRQLYNCDETFIPLDSSKEEAVTLKKAKVTYCQALGTTEHITLLCAASASCSALPPMIIYPKSFPGGQYKLGGPDDVIYSKNESGWVDAELFLAWFKRIFIKYAVPDRPVKLFLDGHSTHITLDLIDLAR